MGQGAPWAAARWRRTRRQRTSRVGVKARAGQTLLAEVRGRAWRGGWWRGRAASASERRDPSRGRPPCRAEFGGRCRVPAPSWALGQRVSRTRQGGDPVPRVVWHWMARKTGQGVCDTFTWGSGEKNATLMAGGPEGGPAGPGAQDKGYFYSFGKVQRSFRGTRPSRGATKDGQGLDQRRGEGVLQLRPQQAMGGVFTDRYSSQLWGRMSEVRVGCGGDFLIGRWSPSRHALPLPTEDSTPTVDPTLPTSWQPDPLSKTS